MSYYSLLLILFHEYLNCVEVFQNIIKFYVTEDYKLPVMRFLNSSEPNIAK